VEIEEEMTMGMLYWIAFAFVGVKRIGPSRSVIPLSPSFGRLMAKPCQVQGPDLAAAVKLSRDGELPIPATVWLPSTTGKVRR
jgi:hypothetical protein